jgi:hypothetical protein
MRTIKLFPALFLLPILLSLQCSDATPDPPCTVGCMDGGAGTPDSGGSDTDDPDTIVPDGGASDGGVGYDAQSYELVGRFDWERRQLIATERVTLTLSPGIRFVELDAAVDVKAVHGDGGANLPFIISTDRLGIDISSLATQRNTVSFTIDYEASPSDGLVASVSRDDDPVTSRVVYTDSEPFFGTKWLPAIHKPADRAEWQVELTVRSNEDVIANGVRTKDEMRGGERVVRYEMKDPIPTYTMAFAAGELEHRDRTTGRVPLSVWYRRGLAVEPDDMLDYLSGAVPTLEKLVGPYPWPSYAVVLLPEFSGGMENTTITFTTETSGQANLGASLQAHELAHQWFGDWITVATFDDVWIKEGMATLLAPEADRARRDVENKGRRFGTSFGFAPADAIRDRSLVGLAKYTSGPYQRAAWLLTQIRDRVGDTAFWQALRQVLTKYALGSIDSEAFVRSFGLDDTTVQQVLRSLDEKRPPAMTIGSRVEADGTAVTLTLSDPGATMIAPMGVTVVDAAGQPTSVTLKTDAPITVTVPNGGYLAPDEPEIHPEWRTFTANSEEYAKLVPLFFPSSDAARSAFSSRTASHQERALDAAVAFLGKVEIAPGSFPSFYTELDSISARRTAGFAGCYALRASGSSAWTDVLAPILAMPALTTSGTAYAACGTDFATRTFGAELATVAARVDARSASRFVYLSSYDYGATATFDALSSVAVQGPSLQLREQALSRMTNQAVSSSYSGVAADEAPRWKEFFRKRLVEAKSANRFQTVWRAVVALKDDRAVSIAAEKLHSVVLSDNVQRGVVCDAYTMAQALRIEAWTEFQHAAQPWDTLGVQARTILMAGGAGCGP